MKPFVPLLAALAAVLFAATAGAQLKAPRDAKSGTAPKAAAAAAAPAAAAAAAPAAGANAQQEAAGQLAAAGWLVLLDRRDWGTAWETSSSVFRSTVPLPAWMDGIPKVRQDLGNLVERTPVAAAYKTTLDGRPPGDYVTVSFRSKFEKKEVEELLTTVREPDGKWRVTGYSTR